MISRQLVTGCHKPAKAIQKTTIHTCPPQTNHFSEMGVFRPSAATPRWGAIPTLLGDVHLWHRILFSFEQKVRIFAFDGATLSKLFAGLPDLLNAR